MTNNQTNSAIISDELLTNDDATWIMGNAFLILTMQSGFALLESGSVMHKNTVNIMVKNTIDITVGGLAYFLFGYGLSMGKPANAFVGYGDFLLLRDLTRNRGSFYAAYTFHFSFATTATTIVSGAVAERMTLKSYIAFSFLNPLLYAFPCCWVWNSSGFLYKMGAVDFAGAIVVHYTGGITALVGSIMLGPRLGRFTKQNENNYGQSSPVTALTGTFMLWWAWLSFNSGSTFGMGGGLWTQAALSAINTMQGSIGGGACGLILSYTISGGYFEIPHMINSILGGLVSVTGICGLCNPLNSLIIGGVGGMISILGGLLLERLKVDDPAGVIPVHLFAATWGAIAVGFFSQPVDVLTRHPARPGLFYGGGPYLLLVQLLSLLVIGVWCAVTAAILFTMLHLTIGLRMSAEEELIGADWIEHRIKSENATSVMERALNSVEWEHSSQDLEVVIKKLFEELIKKRMVVTPRVMHFDSTPSDGEGTREHMKANIELIRSHANSANGLVELGMITSRTNSANGSEDMVISPMPVIKTVGMYRKFTDNSRFQTQLEDIE